MKTIIFFLLFILELLSFSAFGQEDPNPNNWQPVYDFRKYGEHVYIDSNSFKTDIKGEEKYSNGQILVSSDSIIEIPIKNKIIKARSMIKIMIMECNSGLMVPMYDLYFSVPKPTHKDSPLGGFKYPSAEISAQQVSKNSILYKIMCPEYI